MKRPAKDLVVRNWYCGGPIHPCNSEHHRKLSFWRQNSRYSSNAPKGNERNLETGNTSSSSNMIPSSWRQNQRVSSKPPNGSIEETGFQRVRCTGTDRAYKSGSARHLHLSSLPFIIKEQPAYSTRTREYCPSSTSSVPDQDEPIYPSLIDGSIPVLTL